MYLLILLKLQIYRNCVSTGTSFQKECTTMRYCFHVGFVIKLNNTSILFDTR